MVARAAASETVQRFDVVLVRLDPTIGSEIQKTRPCVVISPDQTNRHLQTLIVAPMTTRGQAYPWRVRCRFQGQQGRVALDQIRAVDRTRVVKRLGTIGAKTQVAILDALQRMFAP
jgi:mRNA interferase MazF